MHALSLGTWWIHITSVLEWIVAIVAIQRYGQRRREGGWRWLSLAMLPALASAMAACNWHLFDNSAALKGLVVLQAGLTTLGNIALAIAALNLLRRQRLGLDAAVSADSGAVAEAAPIAAGQSGMLAASSPADSLSALRQTTSASPFPAASGPEHAAAGGPEAASSMPFGGARA